MNKHFLVAVVSFLILFFTAINSQTFKTLPYITIPGNNTDIDVSYYDPYDPWIAHICWVNQYNSIYSIYLKQTIDKSDKNILIFSDTNQIANPKIVFEFNGINDNKIRFVWQSFINNHWQILSRESINDSLTDIIAITDSLTDNITPTLNTSYIAWVQNGNLLLKYFNFNDEKTYLIDSIDCSNPHTAKYGGPYIVYEKGKTGNKQIYIAENNSNTWSVGKFSKGINNINPYYSEENRNPCYEVYENGVWKVVYYIGGYDTTDNVSYNCEDPETFYYEGITKRSYITPFFVVFDSDSIKNNKEIILKTKDYPDTTLNLSNAEGDDYLPHISVFISQANPVIAIYWVHDYNGKKDIWMATTSFHPIIGAINDPVGNSNNFSLSQNYPNPFNPTTLIKYQLSKDGFATLKVYDVLGRFIRTLVNEYKRKGSFNIIFDASGLTSGVYYYQLGCNNFISTKKMILLK